MSAPINPNLASDDRSSRSPDWYAQQWKQLCEVLDVTDPSEVVPRVRTLKRNLDQLDEGDRPPMEGLVTISEVEEVFHEMNEKMKTLRERNATLSERLQQGDASVHSTRQELLRKAKQLLDSLDASTMEEARRRIKKLNRRLVTLYKEKERLVQAGFEDAAEAIETLDRLREERDHLEAKYEQLETECQRLKQERERGVERSTPSDTRPDPDTSVLEAAVAIRDTIGVTSPDEAIAFYKVIEKLYEQIRRRAEAAGMTADAPSDTVFDMLHSIAKLLRALPEPGMGDGRAMPPNEDRAQVPRIPNRHAAENPAGDNAFALARKSLEHQLEALYREKEILLHHDLNSAREAVDRLRTQQQRIDALLQENRQYEQRFEQLEMELGTARVASLVKAVRSLEAEGETSISELLNGQSVPSQSSTASSQGPRIEATPPLLPPEILGRIHEMPKRKLDVLDVGLLQLGNEGSVEYANPAALQLPSLQTVDDPEAILGDNFFTDLAPCTCTPLFRGRFRKGKEGKEVDARFPYTFVHSEQQPATFAIHLYHNPQHKATWVLFRPL